MPPLTRRYYYFAGIIEAAYSALLKMTSYKTNDHNNRPIYILPLVNINVYWPIIGNLYCITMVLIYWSVRPSSKRGRDKVKGMNVGYVIFASRDKLFIGVFENL